MIELPQQFLERMKAELGEAYGDFVSSYDRQPYKAIRINTLKITPQKFAEISPFALENRVPWEDNAFYVTEEHAGKTLLHTAGLYYVQEPSAMAAAPLLQAEPGDKVLDLCSAPGGKGTQLAQAMCGEGIIVMNEINLSRAKILSQNVERLGISNAAVISENPEKVCEHFQGYFDKVLVDAPCSGEGMFLKEPAAVREWSLLNVETCARRQALILDSAQKAVRGGGLLLYSTCTFSREEDEEQIENFLKKYPNFKLLTMKKLLPHECKGEGHFLALLKKDEIDEECDVPPFVCKADKKLCEEWKFFQFDTHLHMPDDGNLHRAGEFLYQIPKDCPSLPFKTLRVGVRLCEIVEGAKYSSERLKPCHALAMCWNSKKSATFSINEESAYSYLRGNEVRFKDVDNLMQYGWFVVTHLGYPLGWCKISQSHDECVAKNHLPRGLRI